MFWYSFLTGTSFKCTGGVRLAGLWKWSKYWAEERTSVFFAQHLQSTTAARLHLCWIINLGLVFLKNKEESASSSGYMTMFWRRQM